MFNLGQHAVANAKQTEEKGEDEKDIKADKRMISDCRVVTDEEEDLETYKFVLYMLVGCYSLLACGLGPCYGGSNFHYHLPNWKLILII
jgi:hypothetical protein